MDDTIKGVCRGLSFTITAVLAAFLVKSVLTGKGAQIEVIVITFILAFLITLMATIGWSEDEDE